MLVPFHWVCLLFLISWSSARPTATVSPADGLIVWPQRVSLQKNLGRTRRVDLDTNASRFKRGLTPLPPVKQYDATKHNALQPRISGIPDTSASGDFEFNRCVFTGGSADFQLGSVMAGSPAEAVEACITLASDDAAVNNYILQNIVITQIASSSGAYDCAANISDFFLIIGEEECSESNTGVYVLSPP